MLTWKNGQFYMKGKPFEIHSGSIHYFRSLPEKWPELLQKLKNCGLNTVETYCAWNLHEKKPGVFDFEGRLDVERFVSLAAQMGLYVIVRPGPYICAEWDNGGIPAWLLKDESFRMRTDDGDYLQYVKRYFNELMTRLAKHTTDHGGPIILFAAENEYGSFGNSTAYMNKSAELIRSYGIQVPLFTADGHTRMFLNGGHADGCFHAYDFGYDGQLLPEHFEAHEELQPEVPFFHVEHWVGMFAHWAEPVITYGHEEAALETRQHLARGDSFNLYMFHGGTNYGFTAGANMVGYDPDNPLKVRYAPDITSYDYDALLTEWGEVTPKYLAIQKAMAEHLNRELPTNPPVPLQNIGPVAVTRIAPLFDNLEKIGTRHTSACLYSMEHYDQTEGYILYRTVIHTRQRVEKLCFSGLADRVHIYFNGIHRGTIYRNDEKQFLNVDGWMDEGGVLELLVDELGRVNFGPDMDRGDRKGILNHVYITQTAGPRQILNNWEVYCLPMEDLSGLTFRDIGVTDGKPAFFRGTFHTEENKDCFIHPEGFTKGFITVNGFCLGRYWNVGPQMSLYLPGSILRRENEIVIFDEEPTGAPALSIRDDHILGALRTDARPETIV